MLNECVLKVENLKVEFATPRGAAIAVDDVSLEIRPGEVLGVVGESGSGKSVTALSVMGLLDYPGRVAAGRIELGGEDLLALSERQMRAIRGTRMSMIFQDPTTTLNPVLRVGEQITEVLRWHSNLSRREAEKRASSLLEMVGIVGSQRRLRQYPHQLSGGMQQRVVIAIALALEPELLLADEPTTALDVTIQAEILDLIQRLQRESGTATMMISHDLGVIARTSDRVAVMYAGKVVESGSVADVIEQPAHPYTAGLLAAVPRLAQGNGTILQAIPGNAFENVHPPSGCRFHGRCAYAMDVCRTEEPQLAEWRSRHLVACHLYVSGSRQSASGHAAQSPMPVQVLERSPARPAANRANNQALLRVEDLVKEFPAGWRWDGFSLPRRRLMRAVDGVTFDIHPREALGLVGESGCGKTTTARLIMGLEEPTSGRILVGNEDTASLSKGALRERRRALQMVFQNPYASLDPRWTVERVVAEQLDVQNTLSRAQRRERVRELLSSVSLTDVHRTRYPHQLSGGQRQRVAIARALALDAELLVADEPVSSLDVSIQAQILELLASLREDLGLSLLFVSHNLAVVNYLCDRVVVMYGGQIMEIGPTARVLGNPRHPYTALLVSAVPEPTVHQRRDRIVASGEPTRTSENPECCPFHTRCVHAVDVCRVERPPAVSAGDGQVVRCHLVASGEL